MEDKLIIKQINKKYDTELALENVARYVVREKRNEEEGKVLCWKAFGASGVELHENDEQKYPTHLDIDKIEETLVNYYTFCLMILYRVSREKEKYKKLAQNTFERIFSLYLFDFETELLCTKINEVAKSISDGGNESKMRLAEYIYKNFSSEVIHAIYYSPGIYHRVELAEYINRIDLSVDDFLAVYETCNEVNMSRRATGEHLIQRINEINQEYFSYEKSYLMTTLFKDRDEITIKDVEKECEKCGYYEEYVKFYEVVYDGIQEEIKDKNVTNNRIPFDKSVAQKIISYCTPKIDTIKKSFYPTKNKVTISYLIKAVLPDGTELPTVEVETFDNISCFKLWGILDVHSKIAKQLLIQKLQFETVLLEPKIYICCHQGYQEYEKLPIWILGDKIIKAPQIDKAVTIENPLFYPNTCTDNREYLHKLVGELSILCLILVWCCSIIHFWQL